jgi:type II secretory pathway component GspD/PulD (secretin)
LKLPTILLLFCAFICWAAGDPAAVRLAKQAEKARDAGHLVRAYMLYAEAAARDPQNATYRAERDAIAPLAKLLTKAQVQPLDISAEIAAAEKQHPGVSAPVELASKEEWEREAKLQPIPRVEANSSRHDFDIRGNEKTLLQQVTSAYGVQALWDPQIESHPNIRFQITHADFRAAMEALTAATHTFVFPVSAKVVFFATDTETKRSEYEPNILLTFPLPNALGEKDLIEAANAVRAVLGLRTVGWDSANRVVMIRDRVTKARIGRALLEAVLLPRAQVSFDVQIVTLDSNRTYHYGAALQTTYQLINFGHLGGFQSLLPTIANATRFLAFGGGATLFGVGLTDATLFAQYSKSFTRNLYDATVVVSDGGTASLHVGDKYPIPQSLYTGFQQSTPSIYNPIGEFTLEDLGLVLKMTPRVSGDGDISLDIEADYKALGTQTFNTVPAISERQFKGSIVVGEGQWAVLAGMDETTRNVTRSGLIGLSQIPWLNQILSENTRNTQTSNTLLLIKPTITRLPMSADISPQFLLGQQHGERVLL